MIQLIVDKAINIEPNHLVSLIDKTDEIFYSITMDESAPDNSFLITGNIKHYPNNFRVITAKQAVDMVEIVLQAYK